MDSEIKISVPSSSDGSKIAFGNPTVPMLLESVLGRVVVLVLTERPFIDDGTVARVVKKAGGDPWLRQNEKIPERQKKKTNLEDEPSPKVDTSHFLRAIRKTWGKGEGGGENNEAEDGRKGKTRGEPHGARKECGRVGGEEASGSIGFI